MRLLAPALAAVAAAPRRPARAAAAGRRPLRDAVRPAGRAQRLGAGAARAGQPALVVVRGARARGCPPGAALRQPAACAPTCCGRWSRRSRAAISARCWPGCRRTCAPMRCAGCNWPRRRHDGPAFVLRDAWRAPAQRRAAAPAAAAPAGSTSSRCACSSAAARRWPSRCGWPAAGAGAAPARPAPRLRVPAGAEALTRRSPPVTGAGRGHPRAGRRAR